MANNYLANELKRHYRRVGNKIVFSNDMSLNELAWEMWERLGYKEIDPSVISRVLAGERVFDFRQLSVFAKLLKINSQEKDKLKKALYEELASRYGLERDFFKLSGGGLVASSFEKLLVDNVTKIHQARLGDSPVLASVWADNVKHLLHAEIAREKDPSRLRRLFFILANLLKEDGHTKLGVSLLANIDRNISGIAAELQEIGTELKDTTVIGDGYVFAGAVFYSLEDYQRASENFEKGSSLLEIPEEQCFSLRLLLLNYAYLGRVLEFDRVKVRLLKLGGQISLNEECELYEGLSRGSALLGRKKDAENFMQKSLDVLKKLFDVNDSYKILRKLQVTRSEIEMGIVLQDKFVIDRSESIGKESIRVGKLFGYAYGEKIERLINRTVS